VQDQQGNWWMVFLAFRTIGQFGEYHHLGRETYLTPIEWKDDWFVLPRGEKVVYTEMEAGNLLPHLWEDEPSRDDFDSPQLKFCWNFLRNPRDEDWSLMEREGWLRLKGSAVTLNDVDSPAFIGRRQQHFECKATARLDFSSQQEGDEAGLTVLMNDTHHYEIAVTFRDGVRCVIVRRRIGDLSAIVAQENIGNGLVELQIQADRKQYTFSYKLEGQSAKDLATGSTRYLSSEVAGGFTGVYFAMYATGNGRRASVPADFDWFDYQIL
jgi:xylan 1,4-beta-xylosidase